MEVEKILVMDEDRNIIRSINKEFVDENNPGQQRENSGDILPFSRKGCANLYP
jgi:hypothetical protein